MLAATLLCFALLSFGQEEGQGRRNNSPGSTTNTCATNDGCAFRSIFATAGRAPGTATPPVEEPPVITHHEIRVGGRTLRYTATVGMMPIKNREGETEARIFFMAYTLDDAGEPRPPPADVFFQWRTRFGFGVAAPGRDWTKARAHESRRHHARPRLINWLTTNTPGSIKPIWFSSIRSAPVTAASSGQTGAEVLA